MHVHILYSAISKYVHHLLLSGWGSRALSKYFDTGNCATIHVNTLHVKSLCNDIFTCEAISSLGKPPDCQQSFFCFVMTQPQLHCIVYLADNQLNSQVKFSLSFKNWFQFNKSCFSPQFSIFNNQSLCFGWWNWYMMMWK